MEVTIVHVRGFFGSVTTTSRACSKGKIAADPFSQDEESLKEAETSENDG